MFYIKDENGTKVPVDSNNIFTVCPNCLKEHRIVPLDLARCLELDAGLWCDECSEAEQQTTMAARTPHLRIIRGKE